MGDILANLTNPQFWLSAVPVMVLFILSLTVHEYSHARVAYALDDDTAARQGRMTLNPLVHIDPIGTILLPLFGAASGWPLIGWAKPVPVSPVRMTRRLSMRAGLALSSIAGPASNVVLALVCTALLWLVVASGIVPLSRTTSTAGVFLSSMARINVWLAVFNMLPVPPLDGSRLLPRSLDGFMERIQTFSYVFLMLIVVVGGSFLSMLSNTLVTILFSLFGMNPAHFPGLL